MRRITIFLMMFVSTTLLANATDTNVTFTSETYIGDDKYGNNLYEQTVTIKTTDFKVDNFWKKFSWSGTGSNETNFAEIITSGKVRMSVESSYLCKDAGLDSQGCSGQKPFLVNKGILNNADMKVDASGNNLASGEYRIPFDGASNYNSANDDAFYALDVFRDSAYYQDSNGSDATQDKPTSFFGTLIKMMSSFFSTSAGTTLTSTDSPEIRNRYIANISFGLQDDYMLEKAISNELDTALTNGATATQATLLDYNSELVGERTECNILFLTLNSSSFTCKAVSFFGLSNFIPFVNTTTEVKMTPHLVAEDTETTLLSLAGKLDGVNYLSTKATETVSGRTTFLSELFKPITFVFSSIFRFFGSESTTDTEVVSVDFNFTNPMPLTFIETDGTNVTDFLHFSLLGLESSYGTEVESCTVRHRKSVFMMMFPTYDEHTYANDGSVYNLKIVSAMGMTYYRNVPSADLMDWCNRNKDQSTSMFSGFFSFFSSFGSSGSGTYDSDFDTGDYSVVSYDEKVHKGLILHLKQEEGFTPEAAGTTSTYKLIEIKRGE
ncbi:hypothetical protein [Sulfurimonas sp. C5]|uniref:hypothetical protein n=1 Tax=Sulfurimonas sp. C5 TaxID=3036947 RepID=UPI002457D47F|nr:hypothetical protein [Sulfurimonas sp. C5]MDH4944302.1 hypothetical protein [Sulfurimonas sp. C5]